MVVVVARKITCPTMDFLGGARGRTKPAVTTTTTRVRAPPQPKTHVPQQNVPVRRNAMSRDVRARIARTEEKRTQELPYKRKRTRVADVPAPVPVPAQAPPSPTAPKDRFTHNVPREICDTPGYDPVPPYMRDSSAGRHISAAELVRTSGARYIPFFTDIEQPLVTLEYPADAREEYLLLTPQDKDEFDPIEELLAVVLAVAVYYVPEEQRATFGVVDDIKATAEAPEEPILRSLSKARNRRIGALFVSAVERYNAQIRQLREAGSLQRTIAHVGATVGVPERVWRIVQEQVYARVVAAHVNSLKRYEAFSDNVYGELLPPFLSEISRTMALGPGSVFVDLGSGIGNLLIQASLQSGCDAYGCEVMSAPAKLAQAQILQSTARWRMWGLRGGNHLESWCADFTESDRVRSVIQNADVVLVNNYAFSPRTNDTLSLLFLDLKDGARIVSLRRFVPHDFRLTERTLSSPMAILSVEEHTHTSGCVSWAASGGKYYVHTVDRSHVRAFVESG